VRFDSIGTRAFGSDIIVENLTKNPLEKCFDPQINPWKRITFFVQKKVSTASEKQKNKFEKMCFSPQHRLQARDGGLRCTSEPTA
jgi:hypothetical protein